MANLTPSELADDALASVEHDCVRAGVRLNERDRAEIHATLYRVIGRKPSAWRVAEGRLPSATAIDNRSATDGFDDKSPTTAIHFLDSTRQRDDCTSVRSPHKPH
jgi:hypothetical protein